VASGPLADLLAAAMVGVACFHASRFVLALLWRRSTDYDVDVVHTLMGVSMAGMLTGWLSGPWNSAWTIVFAASTIWFGAGLVRHLAGPAPGDAVTHHLPHLVASAVMLYMLWAMGWSSTAGSRMVSMGHRGGSLLLPFVLAALVMGNAAITAWRELWPAAERVAALAAESSPASVTTNIPVSPASVVASRAERGPALGILAPRGAPACLLVMSVAMSYMLITVRP
jgi:hypothetical protein